MNEQQPSGWTPIEDAKKATTLLVFLAQVLAAPVEVFIRTRFGSRYFGMASVVALFAVLFWGIFWPDENPIGLWYFWIFYVAMQLRARVESARMVARGDYVHTRYNGWPRLARFLPRTGEVKIKATIEPCFVIVVGVLLIAVSPPLGSYLVVAGLCLGITHGVIGAVDRARTLDMNDAVIEQRQTAERFRAMQQTRS